MRNKQQFNNNFAITHLNSVITKVIRLNPKQSTCVIKYKSNFDFNSNDNAEFINFDLFYNNLNIQLLANNSIACIKNRCILKTKDKINKSS